MSEPNLPKDFTPREVAEALGMGERWVRDRANEGAAHQRYGHKIRFTAEQVEALRLAHTTAPVKRSITTGRKKRTS